ncbi:MAG: EpsG family protein [Bacillota bacterium]|nr:EpsG family protein [Bacillota bacterium]
MALLVIVLGLQENVGTDYQSYYQIAEGIKNIGWIEARNETLFVYLVRFTQRFSDPQLLFVFVGIIQMTFLMFIAREVKQLGFKLHHFFFLYFALSLTFFNQFNIIRQYIAVYIVVYAILKLMSGRTFLFILLVGIAGLFHNSALFMLGLVLIKRFIEKRYSPVSITVLLLVLTIVSSFDLTNLWVRLLSFTGYANYIMGSYFDRMSFTGIITKIPKIAVVLLSANLINHEDLDECRNWLLNMSYLACAVLILSFSSSVVWRFYQYFDLFLVFPALLLFEDRSQKHVSAFVWLALLFILVVKILLIPQGEYLYNSIL